MKLSFPAAVGIALAFFAPSLQAVDHSPLTALYGKYVKYSGVAYADWKANAADVAALDQYLAAMAQVKPSSLSEADEKAFYINLYNAAMLQAVLADYPLKTVSRMLPNFGIFDKPYISVDGSKRSLNYVEKEVLLKKWDDPRFHFAVNCASVSCPPLRAEAFTGAKLERQLEEQTRIFAQSEEAAQVSRRSVDVSALFNWYASDFAGADPVDYLNQYRESKLPTDKKVGFLEYNWDLNDAS